MRTVREVFGLTLEFLKSRRMAEDVISTALGIKRLQLYLDFDKPLLEHELAKCREVLKRCSNGEPIAYIQGFVDFMNCKISLTRDVLIPRPETELLVAMLCKENLAEKAVLDLCTGSGCIAIALKKKFPTAAVTASDISVDALRIAQLNAKENAVEVHFLQGNFLDNVTEKFDCIVCNPPYISPEEFLQLDKSVSAFEPHLALIAKEDGLEFYKKLAVEAPKYLKEGGKLFLEIGYKQGDAIKKLFETSEWTQAKVEKDWSSHDRFFSVVFLSHIR